MTFLFSFCVLSPFCFSHLLQTMLYRETPLEEQEQEEEKKKLIAERENKKQT